MLAARLQEHKSSYMSYANRCDENIVENDDHDVSEDDELLAEPSEGDIPIMSFGVREQYAECGLP